MLLRGLLRLHHCRVVGESEGSTRALELLRQHRPGLVLLETSLAEGSASALVRQAIEFLPNVRLVVIGAFDPHGEPPPPASVVTYLGRPFRIAEFARAIRGEVATAEHPEL